LQAAPNGLIDPGMNFPGADPSDPNTDARLANLPQMVASLQHPDPQVQLQATTHFRKLLSIERKPPIHQVIATGIAVPKFVEFLGRDDDAALQFEAAWALTNIASGTSEHTRVVIEHNAVPIFCRLLNSPNDDVREQAVWALGNIAGDSPECRDMVLHTGALTPLLKQLDESQKISMLRNATWTLSNFCRGKPQPPFDYVRPALPTLCQLIFNSRDEEVLTDACWALSYLSDGPNENIQAVINSGVSRKLVELLMHPSPPVQTPALRTVGNIVTGNDQQTQIIINCNALPCLLNLLSSSKKGIRKEACWTISNITAGNKDQIQAVISANILPPLIQLLQLAEFDIRKEAAWAISNATSGGTPEQIQYLVMQGCIRPLCDLLVVADSKIIIVALEGLENILKVGREEAKEMGLPTNKMATYIEEAEGTAKLEKLQEHENTDVYEKAVKILEAYFMEEEDAEDMQPDIDQNTGQFSFNVNAPQQMNFGGNGMDFGKPLLFYLHLSSLAFPKPKKTLA
jgi:importin subunit alpha-1